MNFDGAELVSTSTDPDKDLAKSQHPATVADIAKIENLPFREADGFTTHALTNPNATLATPTVARFLEDTGATHSAAVNRIFQHLEGAGDISLVCGGEKNHLQILQDPGGAPQHTEVGYRAIMDEKRSLDQSKGARDALSTMLKAEAEMRKGPEFTRLMRVAHFGKTSHRDQAARAHVTNAMLQLEATMLRPIRDCFHIWMVSILGARVRAPYFYVLFNLTKYSSYVIYSKITTEVSSIYFKYFLYSMPVIHFLQVLILNTVCLPHN
jgi:hypothetical protein